VPLPKASADAVQQNQAAARWQNLLERSAQFNGRKALGLAAARAFVADYRALEHAIAALPAQGQLRGALESVYLLAQEQLLRPAYRVSAELKRWLLKEVPAAFWAMKNEILIAVLLFLGFAAIGAAAVHYSEDLAGLFMDPRQMDEVRAGKVWTDSIFGVTPASVLSFQITLNNILVALFAFAVGALYGLGTLYILAVNGLMLGALFTFTYAYGVGDRLLNFIPAHGMVELFVICLAAGCGLHVGDALVNPGLNSRATSFRAAISRATPVLMFGCAGLLVCGVIEGYISPNPAVNFATRVGIGLSWFLLFFGALTGVLWRSLKFDMKS
jgi:uncharacterized membrane protein SpoIIM required for sporulation